MNAAEKNNAVLADRLAWVLARRGRWTGTEDDLARELHRWVDPLRAIADAGGGMAREAARGLRASLARADAGWPPLANLRAWEGGKQAEGLVEDLGAFYREAGEPSWVAAHLLTDDLKGLLETVAALNRTLRAACAAGDGAVEACARSALREARAQAAYVMLAPLALGVRDALLWEAEEAVAQAEERLRARSNDEPTAVEAIKELSRIIAEALKDCAIPDDLPSNLKGNSRAVQAVLMNINQFAWGLPRSLFFKRVETRDLTHQAASGWDARVRTKMFVDRELGQTSRTQRLQSECVAGWSLVVGGEWVAVKRAQVGLLRWARMMDEDGALLLKDPEGKLPDVSIGSAEALGVVKEGARRVGILRGIAREQVLTERGPDAWIGAFRAAMAHRGLYDLRGLLVRLPLWEDNDRTGRVLDAASAYLEERYVDKAQVSALREEVQDRLAHFRARRAALARGRSAGGASIGWEATYSEAEAHADLAQALTELAVAFILSPVKACGLMADQETENPAEARLSDPFAPLASSDALVLVAHSAEAARGEPITRLVIAGRDAAAGAVELRGVVGRMAAEHALRSDRNRADDVSPHPGACPHAALAGRMAEALDRVADQLAAERPGAPRLSPIAPDFSDGADGWAARGNDWRMVGGDEAISGVHVLIAAADGSYWAVDAGSKGGTVVARLADPFGEPDAPPASGARTVELFRMRGAVRSDGRRHDEEFIRLVRGRFGGYDVLEWEVCAVRLRYGDVILIGAATELRVAWL